MIALSRGTEAHCNRPIQKWCEPDCILNILASHIDVISRSTLLTPIALMSTKVASLIVYLYLCNHLLKVKKLKPTNILKQSLRLEFHKST